MPLEMRVLELPQPAPTVRQLAPPSTQAKPQAHARPISQSPQMHTESASHAQPAAPRTSRPFVPTQPAAQPQMRQPQSPQSPQPQQAQQPQQPQPAAATEPDSMSSPREPQHNASQREEKSAAVSAGDSAARVIAQPLPPLPDDLREAAYRVTATARFIIHTDGSVDVALITPTSYPRLNQLLLEALHHWRFFPAIQDGKPIESHQDVRVHFNID
ncbi:energy transducer TonB [Paraburkholderia sp. PREW-6R]|uniref:energy transducer TonB n=1 Tax=Paraburkholderia sp. PREW-6R TaxID=3141544 RepID=UPI0031F51979